MDIDNITALRTTFLQFYTHPIFQLILSIPFQNSHPPLSSNNQLKAELANLKSTIQLLTTVVSGLQSKTTSTKPPSKILAATQGKGQANKQLQTYVSKAAATPRPSLVLELGHISHDQQISFKLADGINQGLINCGYEEVKILAMKYNKKGNLILTAHHGITREQLQNAASTINTIFGQIYKNTTHSELHNISTRANVKWFKILINSVPIGVNETWGPWTPDECHCALVAHNFSYTSLNVTQKPSWVRTSSTYTQGTLSSLVVAFEDPDGSVKANLLSNHQLYLFGARAKVSRWKQVASPPPLPPLSLPPQQCQNC